MKLYLDSSAIVKLVQRDASSAREAARTVAISTDPTKAAGVVTDYAGSDATTTVSYKTGGTTTTGG